MALGDLTRDQMAAVKQIEVDTVNQGRGDAAVQVLTHVNSRRHPPPLSQPRDNLLFREP